MFRRLTAVKRYAADLFELETGGPRLLPMEGLRGMSAALVFFVHFDAFFFAGCAPILQNGFERRISGYDFAALHDDADTTHDRQ